MTDLDRLLELHGLSGFPKALDKDGKIEFWNLKAKIEGIIDTYPSAVKLAQDRLEVMNEYKEQVAKLQRDYSHLLKQKKDCEESKYKLEQDIETVNDKLGNELQVKYLEIEGLKEELETYINAESKEINQLKSTLDEIKTITSSVLFNKELEQIKSILAKHEDKIWDVYGVH